jgi:hypothetical protein
LYNIPGKKSILIIHISHLLLAALQAEINGKVRILFLMRSPAGRAYGLWLTLSAMLSVYSTYNRKVK